MYDNEYDYSNCVCEQVEEVGEGAGGVVSVSVSKDAIYDENGAELLQATTALVICNATPTVDLFVCHVGGANRSVTLTVTSSTVSTSSPSMAITASSTHSNTTTIPSSTSEQPTSSNDESPQLLLLIFVSLLVLLVIGIAILISMVIFCRCFLLRNRSKHVGGRGRTQPSLYPWPWFPLVDMREFTREHLILVEKKGWCYLAVCIVMCLCFVSLSLSLSLFVCLSVMGILIMLCR